VSRDPQADGQSTKLTFSSLMWVNHLFVWNFGDYIPFTEIICEYLPQNVPALIPADQEGVVRDFAIGMATIAIVQVSSAGPCRMRKEQVLMIGLLRGPRV
jgi:hypothetical protein